MNPHNAAYIRKINLLKAKIAIATLTFTMLKHVFEMYGLMHKRKGTLEGDRKADTNFIHAKTCERAIEFLKDEHTPSTTPSQAETQTQECSGEAEA